MRGIAPQLSVSPDEGATYTLQEGAFYRNIFANPEQPLNWNACMGKDQAAGAALDLQLRLHRAPERSKAHQVRVFKYTGYCGSYTGPSVQSHACRSYDSEEDTFGECFAPEPAAVKAYREVITTYVKH